MGEEGGGAGATFVVADGFLHGAAEYGAQADVFDFQLQRLGQAQADGAEVRHDGGIGERLGREAQGGQRRWSGIDAALVRVKRLRLAHQEASAGGGVSVRAYELQLESVGLGGDAGFEGKAFCFHAPG